MPNLVPKKPQQSTNITIDYDLWKWAKSQSLQKGIGEVVNHCLAQARKNWEDKQKVKEEATDKVIQEFKTFQVTQPARNIEWFKNWKPTWKPVQEGFKFPEKNCPHCNQAHTGIFNTCDMCRPELTNYD